MICSNQVNSEYTFVIKTKNKLYNSISSPESVKREFDELNNLIGLLVNSGAKKEEIQTKGKYQLPGYILTICSDSFPFIIATIHAISSIKVVKSLDIFCDGIQMNILSIHKAKPIEPQDVLLRFMPPREVSLVKYLGERNGIICEPEFSNLFSEFSQDQVGEILKKASNVFNRRLI